MSDYKRLTRRNNDGTSWVKCVCCDKVSTCNYTKDSCCQELQDRLAELEDKIENGTLVELPCKTGDTVYTVEYSRGSDEWFVKEYTVYGFSISEDRIGLYIDFGICAWSNDVYYTKAEAKAKLAERKGEQ